MKIEPTEAEKRYGWTAETLTRHITPSGAAAQGLTVDINSIQRQRQRRPRLQNHKYNSQRWAEDENR